MYQKFAELEPEKEPDYLQKARRLYEQGTSDKGMAQIVHSDTENSRNMRAICSALRLGGLSNLTPEQKEKYDSIQSTVCGYDDISSAYKASSAMVEYGYPEIKNDYIRTAKRLIQQPLHN